MITQRLYAFWKYDLFPFVLGGEITSMTSDGKVETVGYGKGYYFNPFKIVPLTEGKRIAKELEILRAEHQKATAKFNQEFNARVASIITIPK